ncbi:MAG: hypothetical protein SX243_14515 [Acidobacteriota bacterium]|nr:hypothetical protein [Acidobacteriota bacterium]
MAKLADSSPGDNPNQLLERFEAALERFERAPEFARPNHIGRLLGAASKLLGHEGGAEAAFPLAPRFDAAGVFSGSDWDHPDRLQASYVPTTIAEGDLTTVTLEGLSQLRLLAIAEGGYVRPGLSAEQAGHYLREVLSLCLEHVFDRQTEVSRVENARIAGIRHVLQFVAETIGDDDLLEQLVDEIWRLLRQRPIDVEAIRVMVTRLSVYCYDPESPSRVMPAGAERLISSLYNPSPGSREDPGLEVYAGRLATMDSGRLQEEATACARSMHDTGLVSPYHAVLVRHLLAEVPDLLAVALGVRGSGTSGYLAHRELVHALIDRAVHPETCQCLLGLSSMLDRMVLYTPSVAASLWRQIGLPLSPTTRARLAAVYGTARSPEVILLAGTLAILGQPLGVGQGDNPTCQAARALSLWAYSDPDYLLQVLAWAARDDDVRMTFHGLSISSAGLAVGAGGEVGGALDPVSVVLVPHLDRIYAEMYRLADTTGEDPHRQINPEFHGWRVGSGFAIAVDVPSGQLAEFESFVRRFYACYHPDWNGGKPVIHPQPVGLAVTDALARFVGWHAVGLLRVARDIRGTVRAYFFNPNNDSGQDWGGGVVVATEGHGEEPGESSLPITDFVSRLYLFHYDPLEVGDEGAVDQAEVDEVIRRAQASWAAERIPGGGAS